MSKASPKIRCRKIYRSTTSIGFSAKSDDAAFERLCWMVRQGEVPVGKWVLRRVRYDGNRIGYCAEKKFRVRGWKIICGSSVMVY